jgi:signal transduction histidine kinase
VSESQRLEPGLRLQIVFALAGLMLLAFGPLFFAVASLTRATIFSAREQSALALGRVIAAHVAAARAQGGDALQQALAYDVARGDAHAICVVPDDASPAACAGASAAVTAMLPPASTEAEAVRATRLPTGRALQIDSRIAGATVCTSVRLDSDTATGAPLVRLVLLYMSIFALALLIFAYFALTRLIVRPIERLVAAADRVASGARTLRVSRGGARELTRLGASVQSMAEKLIAEEATLLVKIQELTETTERLRLAQDQLVRSERMASVGHLAAGLAHEIGNPLTAIIGMQELLLDGDRDPEERGDLLRRMRAETQRVHTILRDLLDFARPESTQEAAPERAADVREVVDDVVSLVRPQKPFRNVRIETDIGPGLRVDLPAGRLTQVLLNVVLNAGAAVSASARTRGNVKLRARATPTGVRIEIEDDGPGVAPALRARLFEPFVTTKQPGEGTGLGLAVCRGLVESVGGEIGLDGAYSGGARFYIVLPSPAG